MKSTFRLSIHDACWDAQSSPVGDRALAAGAGYYKCVDDPRRAFGVAVEFKDVQVIYRKVPPSDLESLSSWRRHPEFNDIRAAAGAWVRITDIGAAPNLWVEGHNEPIFESADDVVWFARVEAERSKLLAARGLRVVIGNFATGNPAPGVFKTFIDAYLAAGGERSAAIGVHEYGTIDLDPMTDRHNWLGHVRLADEIGSVADGFQWLITETGLDRVMIGGAWSGVPGWRLAKIGERSLTESELWSIAVRYETALRAHGRARCAFWFTYGDTSSWENFDMANADEFNANLVNAISAAVPSEGGCVDANAPVDWTHTVDASIGLNVRRTPEIPPATSADPYRKRNVACAMPNGQRVRVLRTINTWAEIDWPRVGYCNLPNLDPRPTPPPVERQLAPAFDMVRGDRFIDVSAYQTPADMDWGLLAFHEYRAVMIRVAVGLSVDAVWKQHWDLARGQLARFLYSVFTFTATATRQADIHSSAIETLPQIPTVAIDLETSNPSKSSDGLNAYVETLTARGIPMAWYGRASWVAENLTDISRLVPLPFIVAHYKHPLAGAPIVPPGVTANAWQHVAGEKVLAEKMHWGFAKTKTGKFLDESVVLAPGFTIHAA